MNILKNFFPKLASGKELLGKIPASMFWYSAAVIAVFIFLFSLNGKLDGTGGSHHLISFSLALLIPVIIWCCIWIKNLILATKNRQSKTSAPSNEPPKPAEAKKESKQNMFQDKRTYIAIACLALLLTFDMGLFGGGVPHAEYRHYQGMFYVPLSGLLYYSLIWLPVCLFMPDPKKSGDGTIFFGLIFAAALAIATIIYGWSNEWYVPFETSHEVRHLLGTIIFPADPLVLWWVPPVLLVAFLSFFRGGETIGNWLGISGDWFVCGLAFFLLLPQIHGTVFGFAFGLGF